MTGNPLYGEFDSWANQKQCAFFFAFGDGRKKKPDYRFFGIHKSSRNRCQEEKKIVWIDFKASPEEQAARLMMIWSASPLNLHGF